LVATLPLAYMAALAELEKLMGSLLLVVWRGGEPI
jgi:hypothetical protein